MMIEPLAYVEGSRPTLGDWNYGALQNSKYSTNNHKHLTNNLRIQTLDDFHTVFFEIIYPD